MSNEKDTSRKISSETVNLHIEERKRPMAAELSALKEGHEFEYKGATYRVTSVRESRWTNSGTATRVHAVVTTKPDVGRLFDLRADGSPFRYSPD